MIFLLLKWIQFLSWPDLVHEGFIHWSMIIWDRNWSCIHPIDNWCAYWSHSLLLGFTLTTTTPITFWFLFTLLHFSGVCLLTRNIWWRLVPIQIYHVHHSNKTNTTQHEEHCGVISTIRGTLLYFGCLNWFLDIVLIKVWWDLLFKLLFHFSLDVNLPMVLVPGIIFIITMISVVLNLLTFCPELILHLGFIFLPLLILFDEWLLHLINIFLQNLILTLLIQIFFIPPIIKQLVNLLLHLGCFPIHLFVIVHPFQSFPFCLCIFPSSELFSNPIFFKNHLLPLSLFLQPSLSNSLLLLFAHLVDELIQPLLVLRDLLFRSPWLWWGREWSTW